MKDLREKSLQIEYLPSGILLHQSTYNGKVLKCFYIDEHHPLSTPMVVRSLDVEKDSFHLKKHGETILGPKIPYLNNAIDVLMYLANCTRPDITISVNLLARYSSTLTRRHLNDVKNVFCYLYGTIDMSLFYLNGSKSPLI